MNKRSIAGGATLALIGVGLGTWVGINSASKASPPAAVAAETAKAPPLLSVSVVTAVQKTLDDVIRVTGTVVPRENVVVVSELSGLRVRAVYAETGDYVKKGQRIAALDGESMNIDSQGQQSEFERTRDEYARFKDLFASGVVTREAMQQRLAAFEGARSRLRGAELSISRAQIVAPTDGLIYERSATIGGLASGAEPLFRIARDGKVELEAQVPEALVRRLKPGMPVSVQLSGESTPISGSVRLIMPLVDSTRRANAVRIAFDRDRAAPVGVFGEAGITVAKVSGWVLPGTALQQDSQGTYVWQVDAEHAVERKPVTVVMRTEGSVVIGEALGSAPVVARAGAFLKDRDMVALAKD